MKELINKIEEDMRNSLDNAQMKKLHDTLVKNLNDLNNFKQEESLDHKQELDYCDMFICAKSIEGCS